jgi:hypothetical protein
MLFNRAVDVRAGDFIEPDQRDLPCPVLLSRIFRLGASPKAALISSSEFQKLT